MFAFRSRFFDDDFGAALWRCLLHNDGLSSPGIHVNFIGQTPESYTVEANFHSGKRKIACHNDSSVGDSIPVSRDYCKQNGVFFKQTDSEAELSDAPPEELVVTVVYEGKQITRTFRPEYRIDYPNGEECPGICYYAAIEFDLSQ